MISVQVPCSRCLWIKAYFFPLFVLIVSFTLELHYGTYRKDKELLYGDNVLENIPKRYISDIFFYIIRIKSETMYTANADIVFGFR